MTEAAMQKEHRDTREKSVFPLDNIPTGLYVCLVKDTRLKAPEATRRKILEAAFAEFYKNGFQGGSLNHIVETAGATKGALFHHFSGKQELGYAVVEEIIGPLLEQRWLNEVKHSSDPIAELKRAFRRYVKADIGSGSFLQGCPLNNLAQEMSPLDEGFRKRIDHLYEKWRKHYAAVMALGMKAGTVRKDIVPRHVAVLLVSAQMGIWGTGKSSRNAELMTQAGEAVCAYLDGLRP
jgi:AcrR family transcriptional regulator